MASLQAGHARSCAGGKRWSTFELTGKGSTTGDAERVGLKAVNEDE